MFTATGRPDTLLTILLASSILQFAAAFLALRLIRHTGWRLSWLLIAAAIVCMTLRRLLGLTETLPIHPTTADYAFEWIGLGISALLLCGMAGIKPLFRSIRENAERLARSKAMYKELVQHASSLILRLNPQGEITFVNEYACRYLGFAADELLGRTLSRTIMPDMDSRSRDTESMDTQFFGHQKALIRFECQTRRKDGSLAWVGWASSPIRDQQGNIREYLCMGLDIGDRKEKERLRDDVQSILRHDLKSPLAGIIGCAAMLQTGDNLDPEQRSALEAMEDSGTRLLEMINRYQDIYKLEAGLYAIQPARMDMVAVVRAVATSQARQAERPVDIRLSVDGRPDDGHMTVFIQGEEMLLYSMLTNLVRNALEASNDEGPVDIALSTGPILTLSVHNPQGVPEDFQSRFFDKFATHGKRFGTGLGTYSAKLIAEAHHGDIALHSTEVDGTTVTVRLPMDPFGSVEKAADQT